MLGRVGITGITTTPHLHFQIDTADAPFHPYWPFTGQEARNAGMNIFQGVTAGLGAEKARQYTIHPLTFVQHYLGGNTTKIFTEAPQKNTTPVKTIEEVTKIQNNEVESAPEVKTLEELVRFTDVRDTAENIVVASAIVYNHEICEKDLSKYSKKFADFHAKTCGFDFINEISAGKSLTRGETLTLLMKFFKESREAGTSHFLDVSLANTTLQGYAIKAYQKGIFKGEYLYPEKIISRGEFIEVLSRFGVLKTAPAGYRAYRDVSSDSTLFNSINNYGYTIGVKNAKLSPDAPMTQTEAISFLTPLIK